MTAGPTEAACTTTIVQAAMVLGFRVCHFRPARTANGWRTPIEGHSGVPDLLIAGFGHLFLIELKRRGNKPTADQQAWIDALSGTGAHTGVVYVPEGQQAFIDTLAAVARKARA